MRKRAIVFIIFSAFMLAGCQSKGTSVTTAQNNASANAVASSTSNEKRDDSHIQFSPVKPGTVPQLNQNEKSQVDTKLNSALKDVDSSLKSLDDVKDLDLSSVN